MTDKRSSEVPSAICGKRTAYGPGIRGRGPCLLTPCHQGNCLALSANGEAQPHDGPRPNEAIARCSHLPQCTTEEMHQSRMYVPGRGHRSDKAIPVECRVKMSAYGVCMRGTEGCIVRNHPEILASADEIIAARNWLRAGGMGTPGSADKVENKARQIASFLASQRRGKDLDYAIPKPDATEVIEAVRELRKHGPTPRELYRLEHAMNRYEHVRKGTND